MAIVTSRTACRIFAICDRVTVLRDGNLVDSMTSSTPHRTPGRHDVGRELSATWDRAREQAGEVVLSARGIKAPKVWASTSTSGPVSFQASADCRCRSQRVRASMLASTSAPVAR